MVLMVKCSVVVKRTEAREADSRRNAMGPPGREHRRIRSRRVRNSLPERQYIASVVRKLTCRCRHGSEVGIADWVKFGRNIQSNEL